MERQMKGNNNNWSKTPLIQLFPNIRNGFVGIASTHYVDKGIPYLQGKNIKNGRFILNDLTYITKDFHDRCKHSQLAVNDIVMVQSGHVGECALITKELHGSNCHALIILTPKEDVCPQYFVQYFNSEIGRSEFYKFKTGNTISHILASDMRKFEMPIPPLPEQKKIAEILSTWDEAIETNTKLLNSIEKYRASQLSNYFLKAESSSAKKSLEELENSGSIKLGRGRVISRDEMKSSKGLFPVYSSSIKNNGLMGYIDEYLFDEEMITWSIDGGGNFFYRERHKFSVTNVSGFLKIMDGNIKPYFLANQLQYLHSRLVFDYQTKAHPSVIRSLYKVQIPSINEQIRFEYLFKSFDTQIEKINQYINELQKQKQGLMQRLLTGKVRVKLD